MSASEPVIGTYPAMTNHLSSMHDLPQTQLSSETSSTSSELESALGSAVKTPPGTATASSAAENGPDGYPSDGSSSVENQGNNPATANAPQPEQYLNGPMQLPPTTVVAPRTGGYTEYVDGQPSTTAAVDNNGNGLDYPAQGPEYDGQQAVADYSQEYASTEQIYPSGQDYATNAVGVQNQVADYPGMGVGVGDEVSTQGQVHDTGQNAGQVNKKYVFYLHIKQGEAFPVGNGDQVQYIHGPTLIQFVSNSPVPPPLHTVQTGHGPVSMPTGVSNVPVVTAPMGIALQPSVQDAVVGDLQQQQQQQQQPPQQQQQPPPQQGMYTTCPPALSPPQIYPALYSPNGGGAGGGMGGVYPHLMGYPNPGMHHHVQPHVASSVPAHSAVPPNSGVPVPPHHHVNIHRYHPVPPHGQHNSQQQQQQQQQQCNMPDHSHIQDPQQRPPMCSRSRDDRTDKQREKLQKKLRDRQEKNPSYIPSPQTSPRGGGGGGGGGGSSPY
ncbi:trithorax group protein osa-like, partial [Acanthaster planci]|uniref:Trithorax group protein osa-like n=1 Tax=Acanthaster planci TaxID=133434 RepID=A0A8B7Y6K6_ACAPL